MTVSEESTFRLVFAAILGATLFVSGYYRRRARRSGAVIRRSAEPGTLILIRLAFALPLFSVLLLYIVRSEWLAWARADLLVWMRWCAVVVAVTTIPFHLWVFRSLGSNVSETILTREGQQLVTWGPYRWIRHPLYSGTSVTLAALSVVAANWLLALLTLLAVGALPFLARREEAHLLRRFGLPYAEYMTRSGRLLPRIGATASAVGRKRQYPESKP